MPKKKKQQKKKNSVPTTGSKLPNKTTCSVCKETKAVRPDVLEKRIIEYGSLENVLTKYECRKCRKRPESKAPTGKRKGRKKKLTGDERIDEATGEVVYFWQEPTWKGFSKPAAIYPTETSADYVKAYGRSCARPDIYLNNRRFCDSCMFFTTCTCRLKRSLKEGGVLVNASEEPEAKPLTYYMRRKLGLTKSQLVDEDMPQSLVAALPSNGKKLSYYTRKKLGLLKWTHKK